MFPFSLKAVAMTTEDDSDGEELLTLRKKSESEKKKEEKEYSKWLRGEKVKMNKKYASEMVSS